MCCRSKRSDALSAIWAHGLVSCPGGADMLPLETCLAAEDLFGVVVRAGMVWCNSFPLRRQVHNNPPQVVGWQINDSLRGKHSHKPFALYKARNPWFEPSIRTPRYGGQMVGFRLTFCWATCQRRSLSNSSGTSNRRTP